MVWQKGQSGNPSGKPTFKPITTAIQTVLKSLQLDKDGNGEIPGLRKNQFTGYEIIAMKLIEKAAGGDTIAIKELTDRLEGKPLQQMEVKRTSPFEDMTTGELLELRDTLRSRLGHAGAVPAGAILDQRNPPATEAGPVLPVQEAEIIS